MSYLNSEKPPEKWSPAWFRVFVERLRTALNYIDAENFPDGLSGLVLQDKSVPMSKITGYAGASIFHDFFAVAAAFNISNTADANYGSAVLWSPRWKDLADVFLEVTVGAANASYPCYVSVTGVDGKITEQAITDTTFKRYEFPLSPMPTASSTLLFKARVTNATYPLTIISARIILKLK